MKIKLLRQDSGAALVEYTALNSIHRVIVPADTIAGGECDDGVLAAGIPHGTDWASIIKITTRPELVEAQLHRRGIWTWDDAVKDIRGARAAMLAAFEADLQAFLQEISLRA